MTSAQPITQNPDKRRAVVIGAGVIGLTTALRLQETKFYQVEIVADILPTDPKNIGYTSQWAGAYHVKTWESPDVDVNVTTSTFEEMWKLSGPGSDAEHCFLRLKSYEYFDKPLGSPNLLEQMPGYRELTPSELPEGIVAGYCVETVSIDVPVYLNYLFGRFLVAGGIVHRGRVFHIDQILEGGSFPFLSSPAMPTQYPKPSSPDVVIVCPGLGARVLGGVEDKEVFPRRGQTVIVRAPWIRDAYVDGEKWAYVLPRRSGNVVLGGTGEANDWYPKPRPETTQKILENTLKLCPDLVPPHLKKQDQHPSVDDLRSIIVEECVGLRPARDKGPRIELEHRNVCVGGKEKRVSVVYNYGHGPAGYMSSFGSADLVLRLLSQ